MWSGIFGNARTVVVLGVTLGDAAPSAESVVEALGRAGLVGDLALVMWHISRSAPRPVLAWGFRVVRRPWRLTRDVRDGSIVWALEKWNDG